MNNFEYTVSWLNNNLRINVERELNDKSKEGWEFVQLYNQDQPCNGTCLIFKRKKQESLILG